MNSSRRDLERARGAGPQACRKHDTGAAVGSRGEDIWLERTPRRIEVYDNSHIMGTNAVGAMIVAGPEGFVKGQYRKFYIKTEDLVPAMITA